MLQSLYIENAAVIRRAEIAIPEGFCVLTGETGAGKSVIVDCISFLSGKRTERSLLRSGEERATVCGVFRGLTDDEREALSALGITAEDGELIVERTLGADGKTSCRVNCRPVTRQVLADAGKILLSLHSQNDTATLERENARIAILDASAADAALLSAYRAMYADYTELSRRMNALHKNESEKEQLRDILSFQIREITAAKPQIGEEEKLLEEKKRIESAEKVAKCTQTALKALQHNEKGITASYLADRACDALERLCAVFPEYEPLCERLRGCRYELDDIASEIESLSERFGGGASSDEVLDRINARLETLRKLKRKYGADEAEILAFLADARKRLDEIENCDELLSSLQKQSSAFLCELKKKGDALTLARADAASVLERDVRATLEYLDMPKVRFRILITPLDTPGPDGFDRVDFLLAANPGEETLPLEKCASGGELSRVMLALRCAMRASVGGGTLIFDEIDTGISGKTSRKIGLKLRQMAEHTQVLCVTHSAQIASLAGTHLKISKTEEEGRTVSSVSVLSSEERIGEVARILGGIHVTDAQRQAAVDMIENPTE